MSDRPSIYDGPMPGPGDVFDLIRQGRALTRGDVLERTGLSRVTVGQRLGSLLAAGLVVEGPGGPATGGRRRRTLHFNADHSRVLAAAVDTADVRTVVTDLAGAILAENHVALAVTEGPQRVLDAIAECGQGLLEGTGLALRSLSGIGISVPGPVDPQTGRPSQPPIMPGWDAYPIAEHVGAAFPTVPVLVANDADAAAFGEYSTARGTTDTLCLVKVSTGIGTGIVIGGRSYAGVDGGAGDIGHVRLPGEDAPCHCGARGCLAAVASGEAVARALDALGKPAGSADGVRRLLARGDVDAARLTQEAGRRIGEVMATVVSVLNPGVVVVGGDLASAALLAGMRESIYRLCLPRATRHLELRLGSLGEDAAVVGLSHLVVDQQFSPAAVNSRLAGSG